jgi:hypothetical protein
MLREGRPDSYFADLKKSMAYAALSEKQIAFFMLRAPVAACKIKTAGCSSPQTLGK